MDLRKTPLIYNHKNFLFAAPRGREGILREIDTELRRLKEGEGSLYDQVLQKHLFARQEGKSLPGWVPWVLVVGGILLVATFALNLSIRRLLRNRTAQLRQREQDLQLTLHSIGDAVLATDAWGFVLRMNPVAETLTGWPLAEAKGRPLREVFRITDAATGSICDDPVQRVLQ
ncbi:MAG: PAS domain-containing protein, partial [Desulfohalobiaceae bacterium]|nr:PAS domain-containing protein [Desulfohalobiaceae bacterium]